MDPSGGNFITGPVMVTITDSTEGAEIHYTLDGATRRRISPLYVSPLVLMTTTTVKAIAFYPNYLQSSIGRAFTIGQVYSTDHKPERRHVCLQSTVSHSPDPQAEQRSTIP